MQDMQLEHLSCEVHWKNPIVFLRIPPNPTSSSVFPTLKVAFHSETLKPHSVCCSGLAPSIPGVPGDSPLVAKVCVSCIAPSVIVAPVCSCTALFQLLYTGSP
jgi:hypothetical protein